MLISGQIIDTTNLNNAYLSKTNTGAQTVVGPVTFSGDITIDGALSASSLTLTTALAVAEGGTGLSSLTSGSLLYASNSTTIAQLSGPTATNQVLRSSGANAYAWGTIDAAVIGSGTLPVDHGGTGAATFTAGQLLYGNGTNALSTSANLSWDDTNRRLVLKNGSGDYVGIRLERVGTGQYDWEITNESGSISLRMSPDTGTYTSYFTVNSSGNITTGIWNATAIGAAYGGTGQTSYTIGDMLYASAATTISKLAPNTTATKQFLSMTSSVPSWSGITTANVTGGAWKVFFTDGTGAINELALGTAGQVLKSGGPAAAPSWQADTDTNTASAADDILHGSVVSGTQIKYEPYTAKQTGLSLYTGTTDPDGTTRLNLNGYLYGTQLYDAGVRVFARRAAKTAGEFDTAAVAPDGTTRLNYNGYLYATKLYSGGVEVLTAHPSITEASANLSNSGRTYIQSLTLDSNGHVTAVSTASETVVDTNTATAVSTLLKGSNSGTAITYDAYPVAEKAAGKFYYGTTDPTNTTRLNWDGNLHVRNMSIMDKLDLNVSGGGLGISFYSPAFYTWFDYMSTVGTDKACTGGNLVASTLVTTWAKRSNIENTAGYGWIWESCANAADANPTTQFEIRSSDGAWRSNGAGTVNGSLTATSLTLGGNIDMGNADRTITVGSDATNRTLTLTNSGTGQLNLSVKTNITVGGTVDGIDVAAHTHTGSGTNGAQISYANLTSKPTIDRQIYLVPAGGITQDATITLPGSESYVVGSNKLLIFLDGRLLNIDSNSTLKDRDYWELSTTTVRFNMDIPEGSVLTYIVFNL